MLVAAVFFVWPFAVAYAPIFGAWATFPNARHRFLCIREPKKARQRNLRLAPVSSGHFCGRWRRRNRAYRYSSSTESGSLRRPIAKPGGLASASKFERSSLGLFRVPWEGSKNPLHSSLPPSVPQRGNLLLFSDATKGAKTHPLSLARGPKETGTKENAFTPLPPSFRYDATFRPKIGADAVLSRLSHMLSLSSLHGSTSCPVRGGPECPIRGIRVAVRFAVRRAHSKSSGDSSIRCRALRRSLASAADESHPPLRPSIGAPSFWKEAKHRSSSEVALRLPPFDRLAASCKRAVEKCHSPSKMQGSSCPRCFGKLRFAEAHFAVDGCEKSECFSLPSGARRLAIVSRFFGGFPHDCASAIYPQNPHDFLRILRMLPPRRKIVPLLHFSFEQAGITLTA